MNDLSVIILTYNEEIHIERCIKSVSQLGVKIVIIDSLSTDDTCNLAKACGARIFQNKFINQAVQFQWAMDNCNIDTEWVLRLDADEIIDDELANNIKEFIENNGDGYNGVVFNRKHIFLGKWVKHGGRYPLPMLRLFRNGTAHIEQRWMDEHLVLDEGESITLTGGFSDDNLNNVQWFIDKHNKYAAREMIDIMLKRLKPEDDAKISQGTGLKIRITRFLKQKVYMKLPYFLRPMLYFLYRYIVQLGFLDGASGFAYHFMQGFWYRSLVDLMCLEVDREWKNCSSDEEKIAVLEKITGHKL